MPRTTHLAPSRCPWCGYQVDAASGLTHDKAPKPEDVTLCIGCGKWCVFDAGLGLKKPTAADMAEIAGDPETALLRAAWLASREAAGHG